MQLINSFEAVGLFTNLLNGMNAEVNFMNENEHGLNEDERTRIPCRIINEEYFSEEFIRESACTICTDSYNMGDEVLTLPVCQHIYHTRCVLPWLNKKAICPNCRSNVRSNLQTLADSQNQLV